MPSGVSRKLGCSPHPHGSNGQTIPVPKFRTYGTGFEMVYFVALKVLL